MSQPTARTLKWLRDRGHYACVVERYCSFTKRRHDAFNFGDILCFAKAALRQPHSVLLVQTTSGSNVSSRIAKIVAEPAAAAWLEDDRRGILVIGWAKRGARGKRKLWTPRIVRVLSGGKTEDVTEPTEGG